MTDYTHHLGTVPGVICNSIGGVGSTFLFDIVQDNVPGTSPNNFPPGSQHWKHTIFPPQFQEVRKALFVFGRPDLAVLSIFRRGICSVHLWNKGLPRADLDLEDYIDNGADVLRTEEHLRHWTTPGAPYPILCVDHESIFARKKEIVEFFGLGDEIVAQFPEPKARSSSLSVLDELGEDYRARYLEILAGAMDTYAGLGSFFLVE